MVSSRTPLFFIAVAAGALAVVVEVAALGILPRATTEADVEAPPGLGIPYLALVDGLLLLLLVLQATSVVITQEVAAKIQGIATLVLSIVWLIMCFLLALYALGMLMLMIGLVAGFFTFPVYLGIWGGFDVGSAMAILGLLLFLKLLMGGLLVVSNPRILTVKGLVALYAISIVLQLVLGFLHEVPPGIFVSITDTVGAIIFAVVGFIWAIPTLVASVPAVVRAVRSTA